MKTFEDRLGYRKTMTFTGKGQVEAVPDIAVLRLGVQTTGDNLAAVQADNAQLSQAVLQTLKQMGITDIKTFQYSIDKLYDYVNGNRIDKGYQVRNIFEIKTDQMDQVGSIIDYAVAAGANAVDFISFEVSEPDLYYQEALNLAVANAIEKAKSVADNLGIYVDPIPFRITEISPAPVPLTRTYAAREGAVSTPIEPGNKQIEAVVTAYFTSERFTQ